MIHVALCLQSASRMEVVLFVGPPCCGQIEFRQRFKHDIVAVDRMFYDDPSMNLHILIQKVVSLLKKSGKVLVDNDHLQTETRNAVVNGIKRKLPGTVFQCYHFVPQYGELQCLWYLQWMLCRKFLLDINSEIPKLQDHSSNLKMSVASLQQSELVRKIHEYSKSSGSLALSLELEGFKTICHLEPPLICQTEYQFTFPALILEGLTILEPSDSSINVSGPPSPPKLRDGLIRVCQLWLQTYSTGHVIVIFEGKSIKESTSILELLSSLMKELKSPLHCLIFGGVLFPNKLGLANIQFLFHVNLHHKGTLVVYHSRSYQCLAEETGMRSIRISSLITKPRMVVSVQCNEFQVPVLIHSTLYFIKYDESVLDSTTPVLPLYPLAKHKMKTDSQCTCVYADIDTNPPMRLAMLYKDFESLHSHEELCRSVIVPVTQDNVEFPQTSPSVLMSPRRSRSRSPMSPSEGPNFVSVAVSSSDVSDVHINKGTRKRKLSESLQSERRMTLSELVKTASDILENEPEAVETIVTCTASTVGETNTVTTTLSCDDLFEF